MFGRKSPLHPALCFFYAVSALHGEVKDFSASDVAGPFALTAGSTVPNTGTNRQQQINQHIDDVVMLLKAMDITL